MSTLRLRKRVLPCALVLVCASAASAQQSEHSMSMQDMQNMPGMDMSGMSKPTETKQTKKKASANQPAAKPNTKMAGKARSHASHHGMHMHDDRHSAKADSKPAAQAEPAAKHTMSGDMPMGMKMDMSHGSAMSEEHLSHAAAPLPPPTAEQLAAAFPDLQGMDMSLHMDDSPTIAVLRADRLERVEGGGASWDARFGIGSDFDKFWLRSEGENTPGEHAAEDVELQWTHATGPWWDRVVSLRSDFGPGPSRQWLGLGVMGLAPYKFELEAHAYAGPEGRLAARLEGEYTLLLTNRLILTPRLELNAYSKNDPANRIGKGLSQGEAGLRLRYEFSRQFAPYVGYVWTRRFGDTGDLARAHDEPVLDHGWVAGLRFWF